MATVNIDTSTRLDIVCRKKDSFLLELDFGKTMPSTTADPASTYTFTVRQSMTSTSPNIGAFSVTTTDSSSGVTSALVRVEASPGDMNITEGLYVYDMSVEDNGTPKVYPQVDSANRVVTLIHGTFKVVDDVHN
jgi:ferric-dicitrate binding protein FerR (iron transport regulator)